MTPALIILGFPAHLAVGTSLAWIIGNSIIGTLRHRQLGNVDMKLGILMIVGTMCGVEVGVRILNWTRNMGLADEVVLSVSICMLLVIGVYTFWEARRRKAELDDMLRRKEELPPAMSLTSISARLQRINIPPMIHFTKSRVTISLWLVLAIGFLSLSIDPRTHNRIEEAKIYLMDIPLTYLVIRVPNCIPIQEPRIIMKAAKMITFPLIVCLTQPQAAEKIIWNISVPTAIKDGSPTRYTRDGTMIKPPPIPIRPASMP